MTDYILNVSYDAARQDLDESVQSLLYMTASSGSTSSEAGGVVTVAAYFDSRSDREEAAALLAGLEGVELGRVEREREDWLERYQQSLEPLFIGRRFVVVPDPDLLPDDPHLLRIIVPQEQAFGTGSHETTSLCIEILESLDVLGKRGLDVGAGSGILALAMLRLGAARAVAFDNDVDAYGALRDNRIRNGIAESDLLLFIGGVETLRAGTFDVITMNIIPEVIIPLLGGVVARMSAGARLMLSGILVVRRDDVLEAAREHGLELVMEREKGEWWAGVLAAGSPA